jgi:hypothetical protein
MSFGEFVFLAGFNQKIAKEDLFIKRNYGIPSWELRGKVLEDSKRLSTKAGLDPLPCGASWPYLEVVRPVGLLCQPPVVMSVLHRLLVCISAIISSRFDLRAKD